MNNKSKNYSYESIYEIVRQIPIGKVCTYGIIAEVIGNKGGARVVGYAMNLAHGVEPIVPAHRVVNSKGILTGKNHFKTPTYMQELLENEGLIIIDDQIQDFKNKLWNPLTEY